MKLSELLNVLKTAETAEEMDMRREEIAALIPAVRTMFGYDQKNSAHQYDLWMHSLHVVCNLPQRMENDMVYLAALLHDIGKAVDHEVEGPHALIGADIAKKYNEGKDIVHAIAAHHEDQRPSTALAVLVQAADSISGARPGARKELLENYVKRLEELEGLSLIHI